MNRREQIAAFEAIATRNYNKSEGWSTFIECYDTEDIIDFLTDNPLCDTFAEMERSMDDIVSVWDDRRADAKINEF